ncbi:hypothetical protein MSAN_00655000 [Mycena sanguinolenta]|uniref:Uncharacterized protein n=1 Tax=Mycena sanguinolenta TaxID=230812 RepID=A0A8H7DEN5_9AGAR|nr:hypothetical protein MSAN_00655000 [Mycena sanguinolenta]
MPCLRLKSKPNRSAKGVACEPAPTATDPAQTSRGSNAATHAIPAAFAVSLSSCRVLSRNARTNEPFALTSPLTIPVPTHPPPQTRRSGAAYIRYTGGTTKAASHGRRIASWTTHAVRSVYVVSPSDYRGNQATPLPRFKVPAALFAESAA